MHSKKQIGGNDEGIFGTLTSMVSGDSKTGDEGIDEIVGSLQKNVDEIKKNMKKFVELAKPLIEKESKKEEDDSTPEIVGDESADANQEAQGVAERDTNESSNLDAEEERDTNESSTLDAEAKVETDESSNLDAEAKVETDESSNLDAEAKPNTDAEGEAVQSATGGKSRRHKKKPSINRKTLRKRRKSRK